MKALIKQRYGVNVELQTLLNDVGTEQGLCFKLEDGSVGVIHRKFGTPSKSIFFHPVIEFKDKSELMEFLHPSPEK